MTSNTIPPTSPTVWSFAVFAAASAAWFGSAPVPKPTAVPNPATKAVNSTVVPVAVNQPKKSLPSFIPPNSAF